MIIITKKKYRQDTAVARCSLETIFLIDSSKHKPVLFITLYILKRWLFIEFEKAYFYSNRWFYILCTY